MKFRGTFTTIKVNIPGYIGTLDNFIQDKFEEAARRWVEAATGRVPIWSGMARASLRPITKLVNGIIILSPLQAKSRIPQGERLGNASLIARFPKYELTISTTVEHFVIQDEHRVRRGGSPSAPWKSFDAGNAAFRALLSEIVIPPVIFETKNVRRV